MVHHQRALAATTTAAWILLAGTCGRSVDSFPVVSRSTTITGNGHTTAQRSSRLVLLDATVVLTGLDALFRSAPYTTAAITCGIKAWVAQSRQYNCEFQASPSSSSSSSRAARSLDLKRNIAFLLYGAVYQGMAQEFIYNRLYPTLFGAGTSWGVVASKVAFDLLVQTTLATLPIAYLIKAVIYQYTWKESLRRYRDDVLNRGLLTKYYMLWGPVQCITFSIVPEHYRVTFIACVSFFWLIILSTISSRPASLQVRALNEESCEFLDGATCNIDG
jgi:Mpv17 / PMP22 family